MRVVLGSAALGDIHLRQNFHARGDNVLQSAGDFLKFTKHVKLLFGVHGVNRRIWAKHP